MGTYEKNHYFPRYNLAYWKNADGKLYDKSKKEDREFNPSNNFYLVKYYYFDDTPNLEKKLGKIEDYMSILLKKIALEQGNAIILSEYEINFIQLFLFLQSYRQLNTTEVILEDESGIYQSNNYLFGIYNINDKDSMKNYMFSLVKALEDLINKKCQMNWIID